MADGFGQHQEGWFELALRAGRMVAWEQDLVTDHVSRSGSAVDLIGIGSGPLSGILERIHPDDRHLRAGLGRSGRQEEEVVFRFMTAEGGLIWLATRARRVSPERLIGISFDVTEAKTAQDRIREMALHDDLTGLPNRTCCAEHLERAIGGAHPDGVAIMALDFDYFKEINDSFGHEAGDFFLKTIAGRLTALTGEGVIAARLSGDEFLVIAPGLDRQEAMAFARKIARRVGQPVEYRSQTLWAGVSIGLSRYPDDAETAEGLVKAADIALYRAKNSGRSRTVAFKPEMGHVVEERQRLLSELRGALRYGQVQPFYQPKIDLRTGRIRGFEALARWFHPERGILTPVSFQAAFEDPHLSLRITTYLFRRVLVDLVNLRRIGLDPGTISFNLSNAAFGHPKIVRRIVAALETFNIPAESFEIEVTENVLLNRNEVVARRKINHLRRNGIRISLDDFGTGNASLSHLQTFRVDTIKIDKSFVDDICDDAKGRAIVSGIVTIAGALGLTVVAEGVETIGQKECLQAVGCDQAQGYLFSRPMSYDRVVDLLRKEIADEGR
ncbi:MAG: hypothetical protein CML23_16935 [Rhizobiaceae bacterium]|nr:hypothetical protein [Rhizobiaceae bacterium]